jgi:membrane-bound lytic murein transglycosylase D
MRRPSQSRVAGSAASLLLSGFLLASCTPMTRPQQFRTYFVPPPARPKPPVDRPVVEAPSTGADRFTGEVPFSVNASSSTLPNLPRPSDADFIIRKAENFFNSGKRSAQAGDLDTSRKEFNRAVETLMAAPEDSPDRARIDRRLEEMIEAIYRYDADAQPDPEKATQRADVAAPKDEILDVTFPVDPSLRNKVTEQIQATASQLPLEHNDAVISYINFFESERGKRMLAFGLKQSGRYKSMISRILAEEGIPQEMIFLAQAESAFQPSAISRALCVGIWQFERYTGIEYGLIPTGATDDRRDPEKATRAAARYLHNLYMHFGDWYLAMAAYNCGPACVDHAVARTGYADFWELRRRNVLPKETANYVPVILAMTIVGKNAKEYGLEEVIAEPEIQYDTVELQTPTHLALIAAAIDRPLSELKELNPALLRQVAPVGYELHIPRGTRDAVEEAFQAVPENHRDTWRIHRVEAGDTYASLAKKYSTTSSMLTSSNREEIPEPGSLVAIPVSYPGDPVPVQRRASITKTSKPAAKSPAGAVHKTQGRAVATVVKKPVSTTGKAPVRASSRRPGA